MFMGTVHAQEFFDQVFKNVEAKSSLLKCKKPREVFTKSFAEKISSCEDTAPLGNIRCKNGHLFIKMLEIASRKIFNMGGKNYASEINSKTHAAKKNKRKSYTKEESKTQSVRKICKLQSDRI